MKCEITIQPGINCHLPSREDEMEKGVGEEVRKKRGGRCRKEEKERIKV